MGTDPQFGLIGSGPAVSAIEAALADVNAGLSSVDVAGASDLDIVAVVGAAGSGVFEEVTRVVQTPWVAVELGGIAGRAIAGVDATVSVLDPSEGCFFCLQRRVTANVDDHLEGDLECSGSDQRLAGAIAGRLAVEMVEDTPRVGTVVELPYVERRLLPVPHCECAEAANRGVPCDHRELALEDAVNNADRAVDERLGIVSSIGEAYSFPAPYYLTSLCDTSGFSDVQASRQAAGVAADWNEAFMKAMGEALERYSAGVFHEASFDGGPVTGADSLVGPSEFVVPGSTEFVEGDTSIQWFPGEHIESGDRVLLPAEFVVFPPLESHYAPPITTGLGLGSSGVEAVLSGLYEVIERDATMIAWYSTFEPLRLAVDDPEFSTLEKRARGEELSVTALLVTQDIDVPVVVAAVYRDSEWPQFAVGSGADLDPDRAARSALSEALQNWMELRGMGPDAAEKEGNIGRYADFPREAKDAISARETVQAERVGSGEVPAGTAELSAVVDRVGEVDLDVYAARLTTRDVAEIGFEAVRVLVPGAQPLFTDDAFFGERARQVPRELGFQPRLDRAIHPFP